MWTKLRTLLLANCSDSSVLEACCFFQPYFQLSNLSVLTSKVESKANLVYVCIWSSPSQRVTRTRIAHRPYYYFTCSIRCYCETTRRGNSRHWLVQICTLIENTCPFAARRQARSMPNNYFDRDPPCPAQNETSRNVTCVMFQFLSILFKAAR